ncbi:MAG: phage/plasmid primase, P4 family [Scytonema sp. PMC 1069.18]|nr:phage/plasmid primase, P4 family [Scytonema sp. PMC 1069.18]MEC4884805.1 phage/plasmid primase, P4 family [Scytonema sp. PMC 1070.18]
MVQQLTAPKINRHHLNQRHKKDLFDKRGLDPNWCEVNCRSISTNQATELLGYTAYSDGIWLEGANYQGQFKPDKQWKSPQNPEKKAPKYRNPKGEYDAMLPIHPEDPHYWDDLEALKLKCYVIDGHPCLVTTEGFFKAISLCSHDVPTIALQGVEMGLTPSAADLQGKRYLVPTLEKFARAGFGFIHAFDADAIANPNVVEAQQKLAHQLKKFNIPQYNVTGLWNQDQGKGIDDYIKMNGADKFKQEVLAKAVSIEEWEKQFNQENVETQKKWTQSSLAEELAEEYRSKLAWHASRKSWYWYARKSQGVWADTVDEAIGALVTSEAKKRLGPVFNHDFISGTIKFLKYELAVDEWIEAQGLIPLIDGVLDPKTMKLIPHSPGYRFLWQLPYKWQDRAIGCQPIADWLLEIMKQDASLVQLLRAYLKAVVTGRCDLHRFLEAIGPGGTGKSTFLRLATALVGKENTAVTTLKQLEANRFETAALFGKRLVLITDSERYGGEVQTLKNLTGEDDIRNERKCVQQTRGFQYTGMVMIAANEPVQSSDYTSGLKRRRLTVPFAHQVPPHLQRDLDSEFKPYLPGLLQWVLEMPDAEMVSLVVNTNNSVPSLAGFSAEFLLDTNPLADWMDSCLVLEPGAKTYVGTLSKSAELYLYPSYCRWMDETGCRSVSLRRFSECLIDLCSNQLKLQGIKKGRDNQGAYITGLVIRQPGSDLTRPITGGDSLLTNREGLSDDDVTTQTPTSDGTDESNFTTSPITTSEPQVQQQLFTRSQFHSPTQSITTPESQLEQQPFTRSQFSSQNPSQSVTIAVGTTAEYSGEKVTIVGWERHGSRVQVEFSNGSHRWVKRHSLKIWNH